MPPQFYPEGQSALHTQQLLQLPLRNLIKVRDFAFPSYEDAEPDPRHVGLGQDAPRVNQLKYLMKRLRVSPSASSSSSDSGLSDDDDNDNAEDDEEEQYDGFEQAQEAFDDEYEWDSEESPTDTSLSPGLYRSLYPFSPEAPSEMALVEGQIVRVIGRGGGDGWAVVVVPNDDKDDGNDDGGNGSTRKRKLRHALVPESYLEAVTLDEWEEEEREDKDDSKRP